ncbi:hypothetical protein HBI08_088540 [Parastagonospora nodorum]|nr:hypothetical protein HBI50_134850 [Parastagonospora nodorum]KAH6419975.1 hypothetical protein HBI08_088540 [Parastagonospora nodorum]
MLLPAVLAALAAASVATAQNVTSSLTSCTTSFGMSPITTGTVPTSVAWPFQTTMNVINITSTSCSTVFATRSASTITDIMMTTMTMAVTTTSVPSPTTVATPAGFLPLLVFNPAGPTATGAISRFKRFELEGRDAFDALQILKRQAQTPRNNTAGFAVDRNGHTTNLRRRYPQRVDCDVVVNIRSTSTRIIAGPVETVWASGGPMATAMSTSTVMTTTTFTAVMSRRTIYAACQSNNIVNSIQGATGETLIFDRVIYRPAEGFPISNELITDTDDAEGCCIACQRTPYCAGSFFVPSLSECHLRLTQAPTHSNTTLTAPRLLSLPYNATYPILNSTNPIAMPMPIATGTSPSTPLSTAAPTCGKGSLSLYLGTIQGQTDFPIEYALAMSNGPCGRFTVWPVPVNESLDTRLVDPPMGKRSVRLTL